MTYKLAIGIVMRYNTAHNTTFQLRPSYEFYELVEILPDTNTPGIYIGRVHQLKRGNLRECIDALP